MFIKENYKTELVMPYIIDYNNLFYNQCLYIYNVVSLDLKYLSLTN